MYHQCGSRSELVSQEGDVKVVRYWFNSRGEPAPYLLVFVKASFTEQEKQQIILEAQVQDPNALELFDEMCNGRKYLLLSIALDEAERTRQFIAEQAAEQRGREASQQFMQMMQMHRDLRSKSYRAYPSGGGSYRIEED